MFYFYFFLFFFFFLMIRRPPRSTLFPYRRSSDLLRKVCDSHGVARGEHHHPFHHAAQFPDVSGPSVSFKRVEELRLEPFRRCAVAARHLAAKMLDERGDVLLALAQRGD